MTYVVAATRLYQRRADGSEVKYKAGDEITSLSPEDLQRHLASGAVVDVVVVEDDALGDDPDLDGDGDPDDMGDPGTGEGDGDGEPNTADTQPAKPPRIANKPALVAWLVAHTDYDEAELNEQTKDQLWELIDATEV